MSSIHGASFPALSLNSTVAFANEVRELLFFIRNGLAPTAQPHIPLPLFTYSRLQFMNASFPYSTFSSLLA